VTIGSDRDVAAAIEAMGGRHQNCATDVIAYDAENRIVSCSAYMRDDSLARIAEGIEKCVTQVVELADKKKQAA
jgi:enhancing lycopene biosynthesis protein 2